MPAPRINKEITAMDVALRHYGSASALSRVLGLSPQGMAHRQRKGGELEAEECMAVHRDSGIPLTVLRPDLWTAKGGEG